jgi:hypothetical protein
MSRQPSDIRGNEVEHVRAVCGAIDGEAGDEREIAAGIVANANRRALIYLHK